MRSTLLLLVGIISANAVFGILTPAEITKTLSFARTQAEASVEQVRNATRYPAVTSKSSSGKYEWQTSVASSWTSGFFPGELWRLASYFKDANLSKHAAAWTAGIEREQYNTGTHDVGFMVFYSFGLGYEYTNDVAYKAIVLNAAKSLSTRFNEKVGCIRSWNGGHFQVIVDNMMNLELLLWASQNGGPASYEEMAISHSDKTAKNHIRPAGNSWHLVDYDPSNGAVLSQCNCPQGLNQTNATWARGQAWAVYGFTMVYRYTKLERFLQMAQKTADWFIEHLPEDYVPLWDFAAKKTDPRDSSAASITASALIELSQFLKTSNSTASKYYLATANEILESLNSANYLSTASYSDALLLHGTVGENTEMNTQIIYADYYFVEALLRLLAISS